jgi:hypothetical protein
MEIHINYLSRKLLTETLATKQPRFYCSLHYLETVFSERCSEMDCYSWLSRKRVLTSRCLAMDYSATIYKYRWHWYRILHRFLSLGHSRCTYEQSLSSDHRNFPPFMEPEEQFPCAQEPVTSPYHFLSLLVCWHYNVDVLMYHQNILRAMTYITSLIHVYRLWICVELILPSFVPHVLTQPPHFFRGIETGRVSRLALLTVGPVG